MSAEQHDVVATLAAAAGVRKSAQSLWYQSKALELMAHFLFTPKDPEFFCMRQKRVARDRVERTKELLARDLANPPTLEMLGQEVGCSPFYLSRIFSREVGLTIPQYLRNAAHGTRGRAFAQGPPQCHRGRDRSRLLQPEPFQQSVLRNDRLLSGALSDGEERDRSLSDRVKRESVEALQIVHVQRLNSSTLQLMKITRALISVSDKKGVAAFARALEKQGVDIISTGGTADLLRKEGVPVRDISNFTDFPEVLEGRVKTLHPRVHGGLLYKRGNPMHETEAKECGFQPIDLVVVNLYPFEATIAKPGVTLAEAIEQIDIGGPSMIRSAAKNYESVTVVVDPADYDDDSGERCAITMARRL